MSAVGHNRPARVGQLIQQLLGAILAKGLRDPRLGFVTITGVKVSPDLRDARVYWTCHGTEAERKETGKGLESAKGYLRRELGRDLELRVTPQLGFTYDEAIDRGDRIEQLLREVKQQDQGRAGEGQDAGEPQAARPGAGEGPGEPR